MSLHLINEFLVMENQITVEDVDRAKIAAAEGDAEAQYHLALMFDAGKGVDRNPKEAERWYLAAAAQGHMNAQYFLARMYSIESSGINKNLAEAQKWYKKAAEQGHIDAKAKIVS